MTNAFGVLRRAGAVLVLATSLISVTPGAAVADSALDRIAAAYRSAYPGLPVGAARTAASQLKARQEVVEALARDQRSFGGAWFDAAGGVLHLAVTSETASSRAEGLAKRRGVQVGVHLVDRDFAELWQQAEELRAGAGTLGAAARGQVGIDVTTNQVVVALPASQLAAHPVPAGVRVVADPALPVQQDVCGSRADCDDSIRAGGMLWRGTAGAFVCSVGFTARDAQQHRFVLTAGHCHDSNTGTRWGVGFTDAGAFGQAFRARDSGPVDVSVITMDYLHPKYFSQRGGEIYSQTSSGLRIPLSSAIPNMQSFVVGELACLSANYQEPTGANLCGRIASVSDAGNRGLVRVSGIDACPGDSGGGWYTPVRVDSGLNAGQALGVHSRSLNGCHVTAGPVSWFTALPLIHSEVAADLSVERNPIFD